MAIKVLDHRYPFTTLDHTSESHHRTKSRQQTTADVSFFLAMQRLFKTGMKWTEYKAIFGHLPFDRDSRAKCVPGHSCLHYRCRRAHARA